MRGKEWTGSGPTFVWSLYVFGKDSDNNLGNISVSATLQDGQWVTITDKYPIKLDKQYSVEWIYTNKFESIFKVND